MKKLQSRRLYKISEKIDSAVIMEEMFHELANGIKNESCIDVEQYRYDNRIEFKISSVCMPEREYNNIIGVIKALKARYPEDIDLYYLSQYVGDSEPSKTK